MIELPKLHNLITKIGRHPAVTFEGTITALDPGETTGLTQITKYQDKMVLRFLEQIPSWPLEDFIRACHTERYFSVSRVVYEAYHVYSWRLDEHRFSEVPTIQIIGAIKVLCIQQGTPYSPQTAQVGKGFFTDDRLKALDMYFPGKPHARDSLRHAAQFLTFGAPASQDTNKQTK